MRNEAIHHLERSGAFPELSGARLAGVALSARLAEVGAGEALITEGSQPDHAYVLISGSLEVSREVAGVPIQLGVINAPGSIIGEVAMLAGGTRNATVRGLQASTVVEIGREDFGRILDEAPEASRRVARDATRRIEETRLATFVARVFGTNDPGLLAELSRSCDWVRFEGGQVIFRQGDEADAAYVIVSGRVDVTAVSPDGEERRVGELGPGEVFGELGLIVNAARSATVTTRRDTLIVRFPRPVFELLMDRRPRQMFDVARAVVRRTAMTGRPAGGGLVISVAPLSGCDPHGFATELVAQLDLLYPTAHLWTDRVDEIIGRQGASEVEPGDPA